MNAAELRALLGDLNALLQADLVALWRYLDSDDIEFLRIALQAEVPDLVEPFLAAAGELTAEAYDAAAPHLDYQATPATLPERGQLEATARWAAGTVLTATPVSPLDLLSGAMQRNLFDVSRRTVTENAAAERGARWARYASANACEFCRMLATREAVYTSEAAATRVGGRGVDPATARRPSRAKGVRARVNQSIGDKFHDHCRCIAVAVRPGTTYEPPPYVEQWQAEYTQARKAADGVDAKSILAAWRQLST